MKPEADGSGCLSLPLNICACCNEQMYVVSIKRLLSRRGDWTSHFAVRLATMK